METRGTILQLFVESSSRCRISRSMLRFRSGISGVMSPFLHRVVRILHGQGAAAAGVEGCSITE